MKKISLGLLLLTCNVSAAQYHYLTPKKQSMNYIKQIMTEAKCQPIQNRILRVANGASPFMFEASTQDIHQTIPDPKNRKSAAEGALLNAYFPVKKTKIFGKFLALKTEAPSGVLSEIYNQNVPHISLIKLTDNEEDKNILSGIYYKTKADKPIHPNKQEKYDRKINQIIEEENRKEDFKTAEEIITLLDLNISLQTYSTDLEDNIKFVREIIRDFINDDVIDLIKDELANNLTYQKFKNTSGQFCEDSIAIRAQTNLKNRPLYYFIMKYTFCHDVFYDETNKRFIICENKKLTQTFPITNGQAKELCNGNFVKNTYQNPVKIFYSVIFKSCEDSSKKTADEIFAKYKHVETYLNTFNAIISTSGMKPLKFKNIIN